MITRQPTPFLIFMGFIFFSVFSSCAIEPFVVEAGEFSAISSEIGATEGLEGVFAFDASTSTITVLDEDAFFSALEKVKMEESSFGGPPKLYTLRTNGIRDYFGDAPDNQTIRITKGNAKANIDLAKYDMKMYRVSGKTVNVHTTAEINNYNLYKVQLHNNDVVLLIRKVSNDLYEVKFGKNQTGFVSGALLTALPTHTSSDSRAGTHSTTSNSASQSSTNNIHTRSRKVTCPECQGKGLLAVQGVCKKCKGTGNLPCPECNGDGGVLCSSCHGTGIWPMSLSWGNGQPCSSCHGKGKTSICKYCDGTGQSSSICNVCNGKKIVITDQICPTCNGTGKILD